MARVAVSIAGLGKRYRIAHQRDAYARLTESISGAARGAVARARGISGPSVEWFWALQDVTLEIARGEVVGIIGRNGAGKSTLLKILSRITEPTTGRAELRGRVASLLEVGTGFHPELTGRENIYLSAATLGMKRSEINQRFDDIVEFSGVERFLDTPVKRYSSGMQVRLGFAVSAHLETEILIVDEVLAVGDRSFQEKCLGRIGELAESGRTVIFVSHNMPSIMRLCSRAILLDGGRVIANGTTHEAVRSYLESDLGTTSQRQWKTPEAAPGDEVARLKSVRAVSASGESSEEMDIREPIDIIVEYWSSDPGSRRLFANLHFFNDEGTCLFVSTDWSDRAWEMRSREPGVVRATCRIPGNFLAEGRIIVTAAVSSLDPVTVHAIERDAIAFQVVDRSRGDAVRGEWANDWPGVIRPMLEWEVDFVSHARR